MADHGRCGRHSRAHRSFLSNAAAQVMIAVTILLLMSASSRTAAQHTPSWATQFHFSLSALPDANETRYRPTQYVAGLVSPSYDAASGSSAGYALGLAMPNSTTSTIDCTLGIFQGFPETVWAWQAARVPVATVCDVLFSSEGKLLLYANVTAPTSAAPYGSWPSLDGDSGAVQLHALALTDTGILLGLNSTNHTVWQSSGAAGNSTTLLDCPPNICSASPPSSSPAPPPSSPSSSAPGVSRHVAMVLLTVLSTAAVGGVRDL